MSGDKWEGPVPVAMEVVADVGTLSLFHDVDGDLVTAGDHVVVFESYHRTQPWKDCEVLDPEVEPLMRMTVTEAANLIDTTRRLLGRAR
jgi:hypothetical protein